MPIDIHDYRAKLEHLISCDPEHCMIADLQANEDEINAQILNDLMVTLPPPLNDVDDTPKPRDHNLAWMYAQYSNQFNKRNELSNEFRLCTTDQERAIICKAIKPIRQKMIDISRNIEYYENHGNLPPIENDEFEVETDPFKIKAQQQRLRSRISIAKKTLRDKRDCGKSDVIEKYEKKLVKLKLHLQYVNRAIAVRSTK